jgi:ferric-dicitrate binding protein FerR (iron transport regulator)
MGENSELRIDYIQRARGDGYSCKINVIEGAIWVSQKEEGKFETQKLQVVTDNAFIETLGSEFDVSSNDNKTVLRVFKGKVRFYHKNFQDEKSIVDEGHSSLTSSDQPPTSPAEIDTKNLGGWEQWNMNIPLLTGNLLEIKPDTIKDKIAPPRSYMPFFATPAPSVSPVPSPTPGF